MQDRQGFFWRESEVNERLQDVMERSFDEIVRYAESHGVNNRIAAYMVAIDRVAFALKLRGLTRRASSNSAVFPAESI